MFVLVHPNSWYVGHCTNILMSWPVSGNRQLYTAVLINLYKLYNLYLHFVWRHTYRIVAHSQLLSSCVEPVTVRIDMWIILVVVSVSLWWWFVPHDWRCQSLFVLRRSVTGCFGRPLMSLFCFIKSNGNQVTHLPECVCLLIINLSLQCIYWHCVIYY